MKLANPREKKLTIRFNAKLLRPKLNKNIRPWIVLVPPKNVNTKLPQQTFRMVEGTINGLPFQSALERKAHGSYRLSVNKFIRDAIERNAKDSVTIEITRVEAEKDTRVPIDLQKALRAAPLSKATWTDITRLARRDWILWISTAKLPETRKKRIEKACAMLESGHRRVCCFPGIKWLMKNDKR